jgi:hypothetical protein
MPVEFSTFTGENTTAAGLHMVPWIELEQTMTSEALPPGRYRLEASLPGGRTLTRSVELICGQTSKLKLDFGAAR